MPARPPRGCRKRGDHLDSHLAVTRPPCRDCLQACTPNKWVDMSRYNKQMAVAAARNGALFVDCNKSVANIKSKTLYRDGTHLAPGGQKWVLQPLDACPACPVCFGGCCASQPPACMAE